MKKIICFALMVLMSSIVIVAQDDKCYSERVGKADQAFAKKEWKKARDYYSRAKDCVLQEDNREYVEQQIAQCDAMLDGKTTSEIIFKATPSSYTFSEYGNSKSFALEMQGVSKWEIVNLSSVPSWLRITSSSKSLDVSCERNKSLSLRSFTIELRTISRTAAYRKSATIEIIQKAGTPYLELSQYTWNPSCSGGSLNVTIQSNMDKALCANSSATWANVSLSGGQLHIVCLENKKHDKRSATVTVYCGSYSKTLSITQAEKPSTFLLDEVGLQLGCGTEAELAFRLRNGDHIRFTGGLWDMWNSRNLSGGVSASYIWKYEFDSMWSLNYGVGLGLGGVRRDIDGFYKSRFVMAVLPTVGVEMTPSSWTTNGAQWGLTLEYRPYLGTDFSGFYHSAYNINIGARVHLR